jgi:putative component of membrane protein insertase Oxa1/YidC/SpoIIIJ protein YidD
MTLRGADVAVLVIAAYQRFISPYKGFVCAYRVLHGGQSCSAYAMAAFQQHGFVAGWYQMQRRFVSCAQAAEDLRQGTPGKGVFRRKVEYCAGAATGRKAQCCADSACDPGCSLLLRWLS